MTGSEFHRLYEQYAHDVFRFVWYLSGDRSLAEDVTSETFVRAWTAPGEIRTETVKAWLFAIARNLCVSQWRRASHEVSLDAVMRKPSAPMGEAAEARIELERARQAIRTLPEGERAALMMRALGALPYEEIGRALGISTAAAKVRVHRARLKLVAACQREVTK